MAEPDTIARIGAIVERQPGQQQMVLAVYPPIEADGVPVRVWLAGDPPNSLCEWPALVDAGYVVAP